MSTTNTIIISVAAVLVVSIIMSAYVMIKLDQKEDAVKI